MAALPRSLFFVMAAATLVRGPCLVNWYPNLRILEFSSSIWAISISTAVPNCCLWLQVQTHNRMTKKKEQTVTCVGKMHSYLLDKKKQTKCPTEWDKVSWDIFSHAVICFLSRSKTQQIAKSAGMFTWKDEINYLQRKQ